MQLYWVSWPFFTRSERDIPKPAQFVLEDHDSGEVCGFIAEVDKNLERSLICLFCPREIPHAVAILASEATSLSDGEIYQKLQAALKINPSAKSAWIELVFNSNLVPKASHDRLSPIPIDTSPQQP